jgi:hypothetical protein
MLCNFAPVNEQLLKTGNMNKNLFVIMALAAMPTLIFAQQTESSTESPVKLVKAVKEDEEIKRNILLIPTVTIDGNTLRFYNQFENDITVKLAVNDGNIYNPTVLYTYAKAPEENQVIIPDTFSGNYTIYIEVDENTYYGEVTIE